MAISIVQLIEDAFKELIDTKHLYQSITIDFAPAIERQGSEIHARRQAMDMPSSLEEVTRELSEQIDKASWVLTAQQQTEGKTPPMIRGPIFFTLPPVRTLCSICKSVEPSNMHTSWVTNVDTPEQVFCIAFHCQGCRNNKIVFLIKRTGSKIQVVGRSEFEEVQVPTFIPTRQSRFYSQAVIAFQCGQVLPALFMLRTLIEQHMRAVTGSDKLRGEDLCEEYTKQLGQDASGLVPSFKEIYSKLSDALHRADDNERLFESLREQICLHFEGIDFSRRKAMMKKD